MNGLAHVMEVRRAAERGRTQLGWLDSAHSFSFGGYRDPQRMGYRSLRVINDDRVSPGAGFGEHGHDNMEIITWVLDGALRHGDSLENSCELKPGEVQVMSAGSGIRHSEFNASDTKPAHFLQVWIQPGDRNVSPRYDQRAIDPAAIRNRFAPIASGRSGVDALPIHQDAELLVADLDAEAQAAYTLGDKRHGYLHVATGQVVVSGHVLAAGDAVVIESPGEIVVQGVERSQVLLFDLA